MADAMIVVGADASAVERAAAVSIDAWRNAGSSIQASLGGVARSFADIALQAGKVNFAAQHEQVKQFENVSAHMAVAMGRDLENVRSGFEATGKAIGVTGAHTAEWTRDVGQLTYNMAGAEKSMKGMAELGAMTGRSVDDYKGLAAEIANVGKISGDSSNFIGTLAAQADKLGVQGGVAAFADQFQALGGTISHFVMDSEADLTRMTGLMGALGKGYTPMQQARVAQGALGAVEADPLRWSRYLGRKVYDEYGHVQMTDDKGHNVLEDIRNKAKRQFGSRGQEVMMMNFGAEAGSAIWRGDFKAAKEAGALSPAKTPQASLERYLGTDAGKRDAAYAQLAASSRQLMGSSTTLGRAADKLHQFAAQHPIASTVGSNLAGGVLSGTIGAVLGKGGLGGLWNGIGGLFGGGGAAGGAAASGGLSAAEGGLMMAGGGGLGAAGLAAMLGVGAAGLAGGAGIGLGADWLTGKVTGRSISDRFAGVGNMSERKERGFTLPPGAPADVPGAQPQAAKPATIDRENMEAFARISADAIKKVQFLVLNASDAQVRVVEMSQSTAAGTLKQ